MWRNGWSGKLGMSVPLVLGGVWLAVCWCLVVPGDEEQAASFAGESPLSEGCCAVAAFRFGCGEAAS